MKIFHEIFIWRIETFKEVSSCTKEEIKSMNDKEIKNASFVIEI